ncbi:MAG: lysophospholipid acyltransferase family protein [Thermoguttaceae bacterium]|jgi:KDO2-lipid IV(A) lauroyltransferase
MRRKSRRARDYFVYVALRILICIVQALPMEIGRGLARGMAWLFDEVLRLRAEVVEENLAHAFPDLSAADRRGLARRMWEHLFLLAFEVVHIPRKIHQTNWRQYVRLSGVAPLVRLLLSPRPVIVVTGHFGNFELGGYALGILGFPTYTVARNLDNPYLDRYLSRFRGATGQFLIPKNGGYDQILDVLSGGGTMALLADQHAGDKGCWVEFFGRPASAHKAIALLALEHDAPVAVCYARRLDRPMRFEMVAHAMADPCDAADGIGTVRDLTQWYTRNLEEAIRRAPEQYWWVHRRWKGPGKKRPDLKKAA